MVILIIYQFGVATFNGEGHAPVSVNRHGIMPCQIATQRMKSPARCVHVICALRAVQHGQHNAQLSGMMGLDASFAPFSEECLKPLVTKRLYHVLIINRQLTLVNLRQGVVVIWSVLAMQGQKILKDGKTLDTAEENLAELTKQAQDSSDKQLPIMKALGII